MIKDLLKKIKWDKCKEFFSRFGKRVPLPKFKAALKKPSLPKFKKVEMPKWLKDFGKKLKTIFSKKLISRLAVGVCAIALGGVLVLWDLGMMDLPFLVRRTRREPLTQTETKEDTSTTTTKKKETQEGDATQALATQTIRSLYAFAGVNTAKTPITHLPYLSDSMTLTKQILPEGSFTTTMGYVVKTENGKELLFTASDMQEMLDSEGFKLTHYRASSGDAIFTKNGEDGYYCYDLQSRAFYPVSFDPAFYPHNNISFALPRAFTQSDEGTELVLENGLWGYKGSYMDGKRTKKFSVDPIYTTAYGFSEGFAVMADAEGKVTIRNHRGEEVFTEYSLILPDLKNEEVLGFTYFDGGVLRVIVAGYNAEGKLTSRRETMINTGGQEVSVPDGYRVVALHEGILLVTDGEYFGYLSANGAWIAPPVYSAAEPFYEGLAVVTDQNGKMGLIDSKGKFALPCAFEQITNFSDGHALCYSDATGWYLLTKVNGIYYHDPSLEDPSFTKSSITRGPQNTFDYEPDEIIELLPPENTPKRTTHPENTTSQEIK